MSYLHKDRSDVIILKGEPYQSEGITSEEGIKPGHIIEYGGTNDVQKQSIAKKQTAKRIVTTNLLEGKSIDDAYANGSRCLFSTLRPGDVAQVRIPASAAAIVKGDQLELSGDGSCRKITDGNPVFEALEPVDNSAGSEEVFITVEAI